MDYPNHGVTAPEDRDAKSLLEWTGLAYLLAAGFVALGGVVRKPILVLVGGILLAVAQVVTVRVQSHLEVLPFRDTLPPWFLPLGIACALLALADAWLLHRPSAGLAVAVLVAPAVAVAAIVVFTARSNAAREASEHVCPHLSSVQVRWIEPWLTIPDGRLRAARFQRSAADASAWYVLAEVEGKGLEGDADVGVWRVQAPGATTPQEFESRAERYGIRPANALADSVDRLPAKPLPAQELAALAACREEVLREAAG